MITRAPSRASAMAVSLPMPLLPPVITTVFPCMRDSCEVGGCFVEGTVRAASSVRSEARCTSKKRPSSDALRTTLRDYFHGLMTPEVDPRVTQTTVSRARPGDGCCVRWAPTGCSASVGPSEYGGQGRPATDQFIFFDEAQRAQAPLPFVTLNTVGPTLIEYGTDEQKQAFLPAHPRGRDRVRDRLQRAGRRHRSRVVDDTGGARRRRSGSSTGRRSSRRAPNERRLRLAGVPHRSRSQEAPRHLDHHRARRRRPGSVRHRSSPSATRPPPRRTTTRCACRWQRRRRRERAAGS